MGQAVEKHKCKYILVLFTYINITNLLGAKLVISLWGSQCFCLRVVLGFLVYIRTNFKKKLKKEKGSSTLILTVTFHYWLKSLLCTKDAKKLDIATCSTVLLRALDFKRHLMPTSGKQAFGFSKPFKKAVLEVCYPSV